MAYSQSEAVVRFTALANLVAELSEEVDKKIDTDEDKLDLRKQHTCGLLEAYKEELINYDEFCKTNSPYIDVVGLIHTIDKMFVHISLQLIEAATRVEYIQRGRAAYRDMIGSKPKQKFTN